MFRQRILAPDFVTRSCLWSPPYVSYGAIGARFSCVTTLAALNQHCWSVALGSSPAAVVFILSPGSHGIGKPTGIGTGKQAATSDDSRNQPNSTKQKASAPPVTIRAMSKVLGVILLVAVALRSPEARVSEAQCRQMPTKNKHCHLEYGTWQRESDQVVRYIFDWGAQRCVEWHWWSDPSRCSLPRGENNFATEQECLAACSGWA